MGSSKKTRSLARVEVARNEMCELSFGSGFADKSVENGRRGGGKSIRPVCVCYPFLELGRRAVATSRNNAQSKSLDLGRPLLFSGAAYFTRWPSDCFQTERKVIMG